MNSEINEYGTMGKDAINEFDKLLLNNRLLQLMLGGILLVLFILSYGYYTLANEKTIVISMPPYGEFEVARMRAEPLYFRVFGDYVLSNMASFSPNTISDKLIRAANIFERNTYLLKKSEFDNYYKAIVTNKIEQEYHYDENEVDVVLKEAGSRAEVIYKGVATQKIANLTKIKKQCDYKFTFFLNDGRIFQDGIFTNCLDNESIKVLDKEEKAMIEAGGDSIIREIKKQNNGKEIDQKIIERETLNESIQDEKEFQKRIMDKKTEKLIDATEILKEINNDTTPREEKLKKWKKKSEKIEQEEHIKQEAEGAPDVTQNIDLQNNLQNEIMQEQVSENIGE